MATMSKFKVPYLEERKARALRVIAYLEKLFPHAKIGLRYNNPVQLLVAVMLSAQCTDKKVNEVTKKLFTRYKTARDFARADVRTFEQEIYQTGFYHAKARHIISACTKLVDDFNGVVPRSMTDLLLLDGVGRKTANVVLSNAYGINEGIAVDTHVRRLALKLKFTRNADPDKIEKDLKRIVPKQYWNVITYLLIEYGRAHCSARHKKCACALYEII